MISGFASFLETTAVALAIRQSVLLTGFLSGLHLIGMTLVGGSALMSAVRMTGIAFADFSAADVTRLTRRTIATGAGISVVSGLLLFAPRASTAVLSENFRLKMVLLAAALAFHFTIARPLARPRDGLTGLARLAGGVGAALWFAVIAAGCAYILLEG